MQNIFIKIFLNKCSCLCLIMMMPAFVFAECPEEAIRHNACHNQSTIPVKKESNNSQDKTGAGLENKETDGIDKIQSCITEVTTAVDTAKLVEGICNGIGFNLSAGTMLSGVSTATGLVLNANGDDKSAISLSEASAKLSTTTASVNGLLYLKCKNAINKCKDLCDSCAELERILETIKTNEGDLPRSMFDQIKENLDCNNASECQPKVEAFVKECGVKNEVAEKINSLMQGCETTTSDKCKPTEADISPNNNEINSALSLIQNEDTGYKAIFKQCESQSSKETAYGAQALKDIGMAAGSYFVAEQIKSNNKNENQNSSQNQQNSIQSPNAVSGLSRISYSKSQSPNLNDKESSENKSLSGSLDNGSPLQASLEDSDLKEDFQTKSLAGSSSSGLSSKPSSSSSPQSGSASLGSNSSFPKKASNNKASSGRLKRMYSSSFSGSAGSGSGYRSLSQNDLRPSSHLRRRKNTGRKNLASLNNNKKSYTDPPRRHEDIFQKASKIIKHYCQKGEDYCIQ